MAKGKHSYFQVKAFCILAALLMVFSLISPNLANAQAANHAKLSSNLIAQFDKEEEVTFIVTFKDKVDSAKVAQEAGLQASKANLSAEEVEVSKRTAVISALEASASNAQSDVIDFLEKNSVNDYQSYHITNAVVVTATEDIAKKIAQFPEVSKVLPNFEIQNVDPQPQVKAAELSNTSYLLWNVDMVNPTPLWEEGIDGTGIVIASLDSGAQWDHPAIRDSYRGYDASTGTVNHAGNFFDPYNNRTEAYDDNGHGTHTIGTMTGYVSAEEAPVEEIEDTYIGVAPGAQWIAAKILDSFGGGTTDKILEAAEWLLAPGGDASLAPDVVNNSWGFPGVDPFEADEFFRDVIQNWRAAGIFPVFAAGNEVEDVVEAVPGSVSFPASYPEAFAVGALDRDKNLAEFSLRGPSQYGEIKPEVSAPGVNIISAYPGNDYVIANGTSMAAPAVAGSVALLLQKYPDVDFGDLENALTSTAEALTNDEYTDSPNNGFGHGLVDTAAAADALIEEEPKPEPEPKPEDPKSIDRLYGNLRYDTAIEISQEGWADGELEGGTVVLARGDDFADALAGVPLAHALGSPILLVSPKGDIKKKVLDEINRLGAETVYVLGGTDAISKNVDVTLENQSLNPIRLAGNTRFETAAQIAEAITGGQSEEAVVVNGMNFPDALSIAAVAADAGVPILLTRANKIPDATQDAFDKLGVEDTVVVGGTVVVNDEVFKQLPNAKRLSGANRYETNIEVLNEYGTYQSHMYVATGRDYADALTGAVLAAKEGTNLLFVRNKVPQGAASFLEENEIEELTIFGGPNAVSDDVKKALEDILNK